MKLLLAGATDSIVAAMSSSLERNFCNIDSVYSGEDAFYFGLTGKYDAVILDSALPGCPAKEVERMLHMVDTNLKIIVLAHNAPDNSRCLLDLLTALGQTTVHYEPGVLAFGDLLLDTSGCEISCGNNSETMGRKEMQLMSMLMNNGSSIVPTSKMIDDLWHGHIDINVIWVHISNIRKKLASINTRVVIRAVRGVGYLLKMR